MEFTCRVSCGAIQLLTCVGISRRLSDCARTVQMGIDIPTSMHFLVVIRSRPIPSISTSRFFFIARRFRRLKSADAQRNYDKFPLGQFVQA